MTAGRREVAAFALLTVVAVAVWALVRTYPNYDAYYHLDWGRELLHGHKPTFGAYKAPTEHPLYLGISAVLAGVFGDHADRALVLLGVLSMVALVWAVFRTGRAVFGTWQGAVAALLTGSSFALLLYVARAYVDMPFLAVVLWAAALEAERPRRGAPVMALLAVAGLLRPEAWLLAGAYWAWCAWPRAADGRRDPRLGLLALAAVGPVVWALVDLWVTGDPLHSLHATSDLADELHRVRGIAHVPGSFFSFIVDALRLPVALAALAGVVLVALRIPRPPARSLHVPLALLGAGILAFVITGAAGLSILPRYLTVPVIALTLFAGEAIAGWTTLPRGGRERRGWGAGVVVLALIGVVFIATQGRRGPPLHRRAALHHRGARRPGRDAARPGGGTRTALRPGDVPELPARAGRALDPRCLAHAGRGAVGQAPGARGGDLPGRSQDAEPLRLRRRRQPAHERARRGFPAAGAPRALRGVRQLPVEAAAAAGFAFAQRAIAPEPLTTSPLSVTSTGTSSCPEIARISSRTPPRRVHGSRRYPLTVSISNS